MLTNIFKQIANKTGNAVRVGYNFITDPLRIFSGSAILGDMFYLASGAQFGNPLRSAGASTGLSLHATGLLGKDKKIFGIDNFTLVMNGIRIAGICYMMSGANAFGLSDAVRYSEIGTGATLVTASTLFLKGRPKLASSFFLATTASTAVQVAETALKGETDFWVMMSCLSFITHNVAGYFLPEKKPEQTAEHELE